MIFSIRNLIGKLKGIILEYYFLSDMIAHAWAGLVRRVKNYRRRGIILVNEEARRERKVAFITYFHAGFSLFFLSAVN